jgi:hypothetical protein
VPSFKIQEGLLVGAQPYPALQRLAASFNVPARSNKS